MGWISIIVFILTNAPKLISLIKEIIALIHQLPAPERKQATADAMDAVRSLRKDGDHSKMDDLQERLHDRVCSGVGCNYDVLPQD